MMAKGMFKKSKGKGALTIEQLEGYVVCLEDSKKVLVEEIKAYKDALKWRKKFKD